MTDSPKFPGEAALSDHAYTATVAPTDRHLVPRSAQRDLGVIAEDEIGHAAGLFLALDLILEVIDGLDAS
jgi:hypothetical protein